MEKEPFFPPEVTGGAFKVTLTGRGRAWVEQHQGLLGYTAEEALFRTKEGLPALFIIRRDCDRAN